MSVASDVGYSVQYFCTGLPYNYQIVFNQDSWYRISFTAVLQVLGLSKVAMYLVIFLKIYVYNKKSLGLTEKMMRKRRTKNVMTLSGELGTFVISSVFIACIMVFKKSSGHDWMIFHPLAHSLHTIYANALK